MALIIGNPTNIYLVTAAGGNFLSYLKVMLLPTLASGLVALLCLYFLFRRKLSAPIEIAPEEVHIDDTFSLVVGIAHLSICTILLAVSSYVGLPMWLISFVCALSLLLFTIISSCLKKEIPRHTFACLRRAPWELVPFILSMFVMVEALSVNGVSDILYTVLSKNAPVWRYGISSFFACNLINNIPMSVLYSSVIASGAEAISVYATVVGSNLGACFTPIGALAGIMWSSFLKEHQLKFGYVDFLKLGCCVAIPALLVALATLGLVFWL